MDLKEFSRQLDDFRRCTQGSHDDRLESDCIQLLGQLQSSLEKLLKQTSTVDRGGALETGKEILVIILEFTTQCFGTDAVARELPRICELRDSVRDLQAVIARNYWMGMFRLRSSRADYLLQAYRHSGEEFAEIYRSLFSIVDVHFATTARRDEWKSGCRIFIDEFRRRW